MKPRNIFRKTKLILVLFLFLHSTIFAQTIIDTLILEDFTGQVLPTGWSIIDHEGGGGIWEFDNPGGYTINGNFDTDFAILDSYNYGSGIPVQDASLETPEFDMSAYTPSVKVYVNFDYQYFSIYGHSTAQLEVYNGTTWDTVKIYTENLIAPDNVNIEYIDISSYVVGVSNAKIRLTYEAPNTSNQTFWWAIDNFKLYATYTDSDFDGIADDDDADADNDGIPNSIEGSCSSYTLTFNDYWSLLEDPVLDAPSSPLDFGGTTVSLDRRDPQNIIHFGGATLPPPNDEDSTGIAAQNSITSYKVIQNSTTGDSSEHIFRFTKPVSNLVFGILDIDTGPNFVDHTVIKGYAGDSVYTIQRKDVLEGRYAKFNDGENSFTGLSATQSPDAVSKVSFPVLIDSVIVIYSNKKSGPYQHQAIIFDASFSFCDIKDTDGDRIPNYLDLDADNDGIPDLIEIGGVDTDGNGRVDNITDIDQDGLAATFDTDDNDVASFISNMLTGGTTAKDTDSDAIPDHLDLDADNDGIGDIVEAGGVDANGDGFVDNLDASGQLIDDIDNDGFADRYDPDLDKTLGVDAGADTKPLVETNGSGNLFNGETANSLDTDGDGYPDHLDLDADNDAIPDLVEAGGIDTDGNGRVDVTTDADLDGYADIYDTDDDGIDGPEDTTDALLQTGGTDTDGDGKADDAAITYNNGQGNNKDTDGDGFIDGLDLDADNDGIPDFVESGEIDGDNDGMVDTGLFPWDADNDGLANKYDESPDDGPAGTTGNPTGAALVETTADTNGDGIVNSTEAMAAGGSGNNNTNLDGDNYPNHLDLDADNDGITDVVENAGGLVTADNSTGILDGIVGDNANVTDTNNNGWHDPSTSATTDTDGDLIPDFLDRDADNDGIVDYLEGVCSLCPTFTAPTGNDTNGNGVLDMYENLTSANANSGTNIGTTPNLDDDDLADSTPDYLDTDTDGDGEYDWTEGYDANGNGVALDDLMSMATTYETNNTNPGFYNNAIDSDGDDIPNWLDNQPFSAGFDPNTRPPFLTGSSLYWIDADKDGLVGIFDLDELGTMAPTPDNNTASDKDWRDQTAAAPLPVELVSFSAAIQECAIQLDWATASEERFSHFEIERSTSGSNFQRLTSVESRGGNQPASYEYLDHSVIQGKNYYYRLKMIDLDASFEYSKVVNSDASCQDVDFEISIYPNPVGKTTDELTILLKANNRPLEISIMDVVGKTWYQGNVEQFQQTLKIDTAPLPVGNYNVLINDKGYFRTLRFIKTEK